MNTFRPLPARLQFTFLLSVVISASFLPPLLPLVTPKVHHFTQYNLSESVHYAYSNDITSLDYSTSFKEIMDQFQMKEIVLLCELKMSWSTITNDKSFTQTVLTRST